jgi:hypothetical protein
MKIQHKCQVCMPQTLKQRGSVVESCFTSTGFTCEFKYVFIMLYQQITNNKVWDIK